MIPNSLLSDRSTTDALVNFIRKGCKTPLVGDAAVLWDAYLEVVPPKTDPKVWLNAAPIDMRVHSTLHRWIVWDVLQDGRPINKQYSPNMVAWSMMRITHDLTVCELVECWVYCDKMYPNIQSDLSHMCQTYKSYCDLPRRSAFVDTKTATQQANLIWLAHLTIPWKYEREYDGINSKFLQVDGWEIQAIAKTLSFGPEGRGVHQNEVRRRLGRFALYQILAPALSPPGSRNG